MFFIVWGKKLVYRKLGYVADFCPICRVPRPFEVQRVGVASHVYYVSFGEGALAGYQRRCCECSVALDAKPENYPNISKQKQSLDALVAETFPNLAKAYERMLALEERIKSTPESLSKEERRALIRNPMLLLSPRVEKRYAATHIDIQAFITFLGVAVGLWAEAVILQRIAPDHSGEIMLLCGAVGLVLVFWQVALSNLRFVKKQIVPVLAKTLKPLRPSAEELQCALAELAKMRHKLGLKLRARDLIAELERSPGREVSFERSS